MTTCPQCRSDRVWKDGTRTTNKGDVQRWLCRDCGYRFSISECFQPVQKVHRQNLNCNLVLPFSRQVGVNQTKAMINLATVENPTQEQAAGATEIDNATIKGKLINFIWELQKQRLKERSVETYHLHLLWLIKRGVDILDPEAVKADIVRQKWSDNTKSLAIASYSKFLEINGGHWTPPNCRGVRKIPFIPLEQELVALISAAYPKMAAFLQLLKETGMRCGEALRLKWIEIDFKNGALTLNQTEKYGKPRMFKISSTLLSMLSFLPKQSDIIFGGQNPRNFGRIYRRFRNRTAFKLQNPRLRQISFHTFRHWKATTEYHKTKDILYVMQMLGHRDIKTTLIYTQLIQFESDDYHSAVAKTVEEARSLVEAGFEYVTDVDGVKLFRKRK